MLDAPAPHVLLIVLTVHADATERSPPLTPGEAAAWAEAMRRAWPRAEHRVEVAEGST